MSNDLLINSREYDPRFVELIKALESCAYSNVDCDKCPLEEPCCQLFDSLADKISHYRVTEAQYLRFMEHFKGLKKQLTFC
jgi:hypothetical protein